MRFFALILCFVLLSSLAFSDGAILPVIVKPKVNLLKNVEGYWYQYAILDYDWNSKEEHLVIGFMIPIRNCFSEYDAFWLKYKYRLWYKIYDLNFNDESYCKKFLDNNYLWIIPICGKDIDIDAITVLPPEKSGVYKNIKEFKSIYPYLATLYYNLLLGASLSIHNLLFSPIGAASSGGYQTIKKVEKYGLEIELIKVTDKNKFSEFLKKYKYPENVLEEIKKYNCNFVIAKFHGKQIPYVNTRSGGAIFVPGIYIKFKTDKPWFPTKLTKLMGVDKIYIYTNNLSPENVNYNFNYFVDYHLNEYDGKSLIDVKANTLLTVKTGEDITFEQNNFTFERSILNLKLFILKTIPNLFILLGLILIILTAMKLYVIDKRFFLMYMGTFCLPILLIISINVFMFVLGVLFSIFNVYPYYGNLLYNLITVIFGAMLYASFGLIIVGSLLDLGAKVKVISHIVENFLNNKNNKYVLLDAIYLILLVIPILVGVFVYLFF